MPLKQALFVLLVGSFLAFPLLAGENEPQWRIVSDTDGIIIENRMLENSRLKQLRARCEIAAPVEVIYEVMDDADSFHEWFGDCLLQKNITRINEYEKICYHVVDMPWPFKDRDSVSSVVTRADWDKKEVETHIQSIREIDEAAVWGMNPETEKNDRVRISVMDAVFTYQRLSPNRSMFTYVVMVDPDISLPAWLLNALSVNQPRTTLENLRRQVKKEIYWEMAGARHGKAFSPDKENVRG